MPAQVTHLSEEEAQLVMAMRNQREAEKEKAPYAKYRLLEGQHVEALDGKVYSKGDIFWSCMNLTKKFGEDKFRWICMADGVSAPNEEVDEENFDADYEPEDTLAAMTIEELQAHAEQQGINLGRAKSRDKILAICRQHGLVNAE